MASVISKPPIPAGRQKIPALANGDRLTRVEFHRRYAAMPEGIKAELIEGVVYMASPVSYQSHGIQHSTLNGCLFYYAAKTPGLPRIGDNVTVVFDNDNEPQPDLLLMLPPHLGGRAVVDANGYISGPPALVCEVAASSVSIDMHAKKSLYRRNGVQEYLVWRTEDAAIVWFALIDGDYIPIPAEPDGTLQSRAFPGLWLNIPALLAADLPALLATLDTAAATREHVEFVEKLKNIPPANT